MGSLDHTKGKYLGSSHSKFYVDLSLRQKPTDHWDLTELRKGMGS